MKKKTLTAICMAGLLVAIATPVSAGIIISQYYEGASFDKYIELYNTGTSAVDLGAGTYKLSGFNNANRQAWKTDGTPTNTLTLSGTIPSGGTFLIKHDQAVNPAYADAGANQEAASAAGVNFNGDDSTVLWTGTTFATANVVDAMGIITTTTSLFADKSFVRNANVITGVTTDYNAADWTEYTLAAVAGAASTATEYLGFHISDAPVPEPSSFALMFASVGAMLFRRK
jgi:predicted extracellular nuclease